LELLKDKRLIALIVLGAILVGGAIFFGGTDTGKQDVWRASAGGKYLLPLITVSSLIDSLNPCAFSILLLTIAFLFSLGYLRSGILKIGGAYVFGIFATYVLIGLGILRVLSVFNTPKFMSLVGAVILALFGLLSVINHLFPKFPIRLKIPDSAHARIAQLMKGASVPAAIFLGIVVGLFEFPCTGGPYLMVLGLLHDHSTYWTGFGYLIYYNILFVLPLAIVLFIASDRILLEKVQAWRKKETGFARFWGGLAMVFLAVLIFLVSR
jgi:cytochrome c-type biogenesis protein